MTADTGAKHFGSVTLQVESAERPNIWVGFSEAEFWQAVKRLCDEYRARQL